MRSGNNYAVLGFDAQEADEHIFPQLWIFKVHHLRNLLSNSVLCSKNDASILTQVLWLKYSTPALALISIGSDRPSAGLPLSFE